MSDFIGGYSSPIPDTTEGDDLEIDDSLPIIDKIQKYIKSDIVIHRLCVVREFSEVVQQKSFSVLNFLLLPLIEEVVTDTEPVIRQALVEQIPLVTRAFLSDGGDTGYAKILHTLLPIVAQLTTDRNPQVRMSAIESLQEMAKLIRHEDLEIHLIPFVRSLVNDSTEEEHRVQAANLLHNLAPVLGQQLTQQIFIPFVIKLANDPSFRVRKAIAGNLGNICQTIGTDSTTESLLPVFITLSKDEIWSVRKGCAEVLVAVSQNVSPIERYSKLIQIFEQFVVEDQSRWVNSTAFQNLGPFIATFDGSQVTPKLLQYFTQMILPDKNRFPESDLVTHCAYNFPAVLYTVGSSRWNELSETYFNLVNDTTWKVRRSLSHSLHEVAKIVGTTETKNNLVATFNLFLQDLDEVKVGVVKHFADFLECLEPQLRDNYIITLTTLVNDQNKWRFRKLISKQLDKICSLFSYKTLITEIAPIILQLLTDGVSKVRNYAASGVGSLILRLDSLNQDLINNNNSTNNTTVNNNNTTTTATTTTTEDLTEKELLDMKQEIISKIISFANDDSYTNRQIFTKMCYYLVDQINVELFDTQFLPLLLKLSQDSVPNVRLVTADLLSKKIATLERYKNNQDIQNTLYKLKQDNDTDVVYFSKDEKEILALNQRQKDSDDQNNNNNNNNTQDTITNENNQNNNNNSNENNNTESST